jgi:hypothetical protein
MAEFKLGRIRFVWKNEWADNTVYYKDDVVFYRGRVYICIEGHTSSTLFFTDFEVIPPKWNLMSDGQTWKGNWTNNTYYVLNDIVKYGANLYICSTVHTSSSDTNITLADEIANWDTFATGLDWKGNWQPSTYYLASDIVKYGSGTFVCNTAHTSINNFAAGLENDAVNWDRFTSGVEWKGVWTQNTRYKVYDVVKYGAGLMICNEFHTSGAEFASDNYRWDVFVEGLSFENDWTYTTTYQQGDIVTWGGYQYISLRQNINIAPTSSIEDWAVFSKGFSFQGEWGADSSAQDYRTGDVVTVGGYVYVANTDNSNIEPGENQSWNQYWDRLNTGLKWRGVWADDAYYVIGDVVRYDTATYICIESHVSEDDDYSTETKIAPGGGAENSRPDRDITGTYWNILAIGAETDALTTQGDIVYFSGSGPTRLPIGKEGQVLRVSPNNEPQWTFFGQNPDVYYVSTTGVDQPAPIRGTTVESPWKSIRFACQEIDKGTKYPNAKRLLELNRIYIQRETTEWTDYQITEGIDPFTTNFTYFAEKCERDIGFIVDAVIWDLTHGGNVKSREAALSYINDTVGSPYLGQKTETVASLVYAWQLMEHVLNQTDPPEIGLTGYNSYQVVNGDNSSAVVSQWKNINLENENAYGRVTELITLITDAITAGNANNLPAKIETNTLIRVATGKYYEVLPIQVPALCCIMGDELRSVTVYPRQNQEDLTPATDPLYTYTALNHIETQIAGIVEGISITPTDNNNEAQITEWPTANTTTGYSAERLTRLIKRLIDHGTGTKLEVQWIDTFNFTDGGYARDNILRNREFLKAEVKGFLDTNYPNLYYSRTKCLQDVGYLLDGLCYDIQLGCQWQSLVAALAYYRGTEGVFVIDSTEKVATLDAYGYLQAMLQSVVQNNQISPPYQTNVQQVITNTNASLSASNYIFDLMNDVITTITDVNNLPSYVYPDITTSPQYLLDDKALLEAQYDTIQKNTIDFIITHFGDFTYKGAYCRRDCGYILDAAFYDSMLQSNYWGVYSGYAYNRLQSAKVKNEQQQQELYAIDLLKNQSVAGMEALETTDGDAAATIVTSSLNLIKSIFIDGDDSAPSVTYHDLSGSSYPNRTYTQILLIQNRDFIVDFTANANAYWQGLGTDLRAKCKQDLARMIEAWAYDINYDQTPDASGCNIATLNHVRSIYNNITGEPVYGTSAERAASIQLYSALATNCKEAANNNISGQPYTDIVNFTTPTETGKIDTLRDIVTGNISQNQYDFLATAIAPSLDWQTADALAAGATITNNADTYIKATLQGITTTYSGFDFNHSKCTRDLALIFDAAIYDWTINQNFASIVAAYSYARQPSAKVYGYQKDATLAANFYALQQADAIVLSTPAKQALRYAIEFVNDIIFGVAAEANNKQTAFTDLWATNRILQLNEDFIVEEAVNYVDNWFAGTVTSISSTNSGLTMTNGTEWLDAGMSIKFIDLDNAYPENDIGQTFPIAFGNEYVVSEILSENEFTVEDASGVFLIITQDYPTINLGVEKWYEYNTALCRRDMRYIVDAMRWDLVHPKEYQRTFTLDTKLRSYQVNFQFPANYKSKYAARYYVNAVLGSREEDMYYLRNGTGLRLQTVDGLNGDLSPNNEFGTRRPTAGAYASLDPGWGPDDESVWIMTRSPYVQNLTTFGHAAIGQKIDGALHNGGNDSIVSNDFTQVISDGIGAWITNNGRAELVSVFTYYSHIGYLAEAGGRIRATNGNNSYGTFGSVAEGVDADEIPITCIVDNRLQYNAEIGQVNADGDKILNVEFNHAGNDYTEAGINVFGNGINAETYADEFRDNAVNRIRITDLTGDEEQFGGSGYLLVSNTAQTGLLTTDVDGVVTAANITLAATDGNTDTAYSGKTMRIFITGGIGVGQYGTIDTYSSGSKLATVVKDDDSPGWEHLFPGTPIVAPNASSIYQIEPKVSFTDPPYSSTSATLSASHPTSDIAWCYTTVEYSNLTPDLEVSVVGFGATFTVIRKGSKYLVSIVNAGQDYARGDTITIIGTQLGGMTPINDLVLTVTSIDSTTGAIIYFDQEGLGCSGSFIAVGNSSQNIEKSTDGMMWTQQIVGGTGQSGPAKIANAIFNDGSSEYAVSATIIVTQSTSPNQIFVSNDNDNWAAVSLPAAQDSEPFITYGRNKFYLGFENSRHIFVSDDAGLSWLQYTDALPSVGFVGLTFGSDRLVAVKYNSDEIIWANHQNPGLWTQIVAPAIRNYANIAYGNNRFIIISEDQNDALFSIDRGETWTLVDLPSDGSSKGSGNKIKYGQGQFVVIDDVQGENLRTSTDGINWVLRTVTAAPTANNGFDALAFGNPNHQGCWVVKGADVDDHISMIKLGVRAIGRPSIANEKIFAVRLVEPGSGYYEGAPTMTITDPNNIYDVTYTVRMGNGVLANPTFIDRGQGYEAASGSIAAESSNGYADFYQSGLYIAVRRLSERPIAGSNVVFDHLPDTVFKLVNTVSFLGDTDGSYTGFLNLSPSVEAIQSPEDGTPITMRIRYSQVRLTGHDFLDIGTGNFITTNYPNLPLQDPVQAQETVESNGGRVFFTATDQDGNFRVGNLFNVEQSTGIATLNADAFNIAGLQELTLGEVTLGGSSATVSEFSTDPFMTANSDTVIPTQRAIKAYIEAQIGGGGAALNVNSLTAGDIYIATNEINTVTGTSITFNVTTNFTRGITGVPLALNYFLR